jgi:hypothetical protein
MRSKEPIGEAGYKGTKTCTVRVQEMSMAGQGEVSTVAQPSADIRNHRAVLFRTLGATCVHSLYRDGQHEAPLMEIVVAKHPVSFWQRFIHSASCSYEDLLRQHK